MAYWVDTYDLGNTLEHEYKFAGRYGAKGEKRSQKKKRTPEQIVRQNHSNKVKKVRRTIALNFTEDDLWICLKYPKGTRLTITKVKQDVSQFLRQLRNEYKKHDHPCKYIYRIEVGHLGGIHLHFIINRIPEVDTLKIIKSCWPHLCNFQFLYEEGDYSRLAEYIVKEPESDDGQLCFFEEMEKKAFCKYSSSRNLKRPEDVRTRKKYRHWTMRRILEDVTMGTLKPAAGYYIDWDSVYTGVNPFNGYTYLHYREIKLRKGGGNDDLYRTRAGDQAEEW